MEQVSIKLPEPRFDEGASLNSALRKRRTEREFTPVPLTESELSQILWSAQGITNAEGRRTAPSAGATYPLELYVATGDGVFRYLPIDHSLKLLDARDLREDLFRASLEQEFVRDAPATLLFTAVFARTEQRYGSTRTPRYVHMEVGHSAQNVLLQAVALGLGAVPIGAYKDDRVSQVLDLPSDHVPLYMISIGHPL